MIFSLLGFSKSGIEVRVKHENKNKPKTHLRKISEEQSQRSVAKKSSKQKVAFSLNQEHGGKTKR